MKKMRRLAIVVASLSVVPCALAEDVLANGGFEIEGFGGLADSANWIEIASGAPGTLSERVGIGASSGQYAHRLVAVGANGIGSTGVIIQNGIADGGFGSLEGNTVVSASFKANVALGPGGVVFYSLRILNSAGVIVADSGLGVITNGTNGSYASYTMGPLNVPALGGAPNDAYAAFVEIAVAAGAFPESIAEALIDDLVVSGTLASGCSADFNGDGFLDFFDYDDFVSCFETGICPPGKSADFNGDAFVDFFDYDDFVNAFETGC
jgi:hypothetical protein